MKSNNSLLNLINKNASVNEICSITGLSHKQLFYRMNMLKIKGYSFSKKYYSNGNIVYSLNKELLHEPSNEKTLITSPEENELRILVLSDLHLGNINERPDLLYYVYDYCVKNGIKIIINAGDLIDGPKGCGDIRNKKTLDIDEQIDYMLKHYPFDKNILNFICLGNHDYYCMKENGIDLKNVLDNKRHDLITLGYGYGTLNIKNDQIFVNHPINGIVTSSNSNTSNKLLLTGHSHTHKNIIGMDKHIFVPSLSDVSVPKNEKKEFKELPSSLILNLKFFNGVINTGILEHFIFINNEMYKVSETQYEFSQGKNLHMTKIKNEEKRNPVKVDNYKINTTLKTEEKEELPKIKSLKPQTRLSQIDKFKQRYNLDN